MLAKFSLVISTLREWCYICFFCWLIEIPENITALVSEVQGTQTYGNCDPNPCMNGNCTDGINRFFCTCYAGYTGSSCGMNLSLIVLPLQLYLLNKLLDVSDLHVYHFL